MDRADLIREMIAEKEKQIELYRAMIAEWRRDLGESAYTPESSGSAIHEGTARKEPAGDDGLVNLVRDYEFHGKSQPEAAKLFLERVGHPVKTQIIMDAIQKGGVSVGGTDATKKLNFYTILNRSREFGRVARDTWGVVGWKGVPKKDAKDGEAEAKDAEKVSA